ncbi:MAG: hypothetical protein WCW03_03120 [Candidatus Paceibacterota bacterium]
MKTKDCMADFFRRFGKSEALIEFAEVQSDTERMWRKHGIMPTGEVLLRVCYFLDLIGYKVEELMRVHPDIFTVGQCIAFNLMTPRIVERAIGTTDRKALYRYFREGIGVTRERLNEFKLIADSRRSQLTEMVKQKRLGLKQLLGNSPSHSNKPDDSLIGEFAAACSSVRTLGGKLLEGPVENRIRMRQKMVEGPEPALHLTWETLNNLLSEKKGII